MWALSNQNSKLGLIASNKIVNALSVLCVFLLAGKCFLPTGLQSLQSKAAGWTQWGAGKHFSCQLTPQYVHTSFFLFCFEIIEIELKCRQCILVALGDLLLQNVPHGEDISENISVPTRAFTNCTRDPGCMSGLIKVTLGSNNVHICGS